MAADDFALGAGAGAPAIAAGNEAERRNRGRTDGFSRNAQFFIILIMNFLVSETEFFPLAVVKI